MPTRHSELVAALLGWYARHARALPWRRARDPYAIWVAEIMLQQTQVKTVLRYWERWLRALPDLEALAAARPETLHKLWEGMGYYARARNLQRAARIIVREHGGRFPDDYQAVLALPGIGPYTAGAICSIAFNQPRPILDGNASRVLARLFAVEGDPRAKPARSTLWQLAETLVRRAAKTPAPHGAPRCCHFNQALMELGALVCTPRQPRCGACPVAGACLARQQRRVQELPSARRRAPPTPRRFAAFVLRQRGRFLLRQRPPGVVNARLWEFPNVELAPGGADLERAAQDALGCAPAALEPLCVIRHTITRYRITLEVFRARLARPRPARPLPGRWLSFRQLDRLPFPSAHRAIIRRLSHAHTAEWGTGPVDARQADRLSRSIRSALPDGSKKDAQARI